MFHFYTPWNQKLSDIFREYRNRSSVTEHILNYDGFAQLVLRNLFWFRIVLLILHASWLGWASSDVLNNLIFMQTEESHKTKKVLEMSK